MSRNEFAVFNPWDTLLGLQRDIDRFFGDAMPSAGWRPAVARTAFSPTCEVNESDEHYLMSFDLPGVKKEDIRVEVAENQLTVSGERRQDHKRKEGERRLSERVFGEFQRTFTLPGAVNADAIEASYQDGVLRIALPKAESSKPRKVRITDGKNGIFSRLLGKQENVKQQESAA